MTVKDKINFRPVHIDEIYSGETETKLEASYIEKLQKLELAERHENNRAKELVNDENEANLKIRKRIAYWLFGFVLVYITTVVIIFICYTFSLHPILDRSRSPMITFLSTTTFNVISLLATFIYYLFQKKKHTFKT